ncbi:MAG: DUF4365 domain-containing protein [Polyangiaceae bacterium]|nr:DUF4365 domain-containing protein [Polyangiaceae bacterium]
MLLENDIKEHLALAYVYAVASRAGCSTELIRVDRNSVDITVKHVDTSAGPNDVREGVIDLQVKAFVHDAPAGAISYYLHNEKNFHDLRRTRTLYPKLLVVVLLPEDEAAWVDLTQDALVLRRCGYWLSLVGAQSRTLAIPRENVFDGPSLMRLMSLSRKQEAIR